MSDRDGSISLGKKSPQRLKNDHLQGKNPLVAYLGRSGDDADSL